MGLDINLVYDANAEAAPQSFRNAVQAAANELDAAIDDPITVNIEVGYGEYDLGGPYYTPLNDSYSLGGINTVIQVSYPLLVAALAANESTANDAEALNSLPKATSLNGLSDFYISGAEAQALGVMPASDAAIDGYVGFPTSFSASAVTDTAIVELAHAMGLLNGGGVETLVEYTGPGTHFLDAGTSNTPVYFSVDGGHTNLANFDVSFDSTLFENLSSDPFDVPSPGGALTPLDVTMLSILGFDVSSTPTLPSPNISPTASAAGVAAAVTVQNVSVLENKAIPVLSLITSVSAPSGDSIAYYGFYDQGGGSGYFSVNGVAEPDNQWIYALDTQLNLLQYVGGSSPGSDALAVVGFDYEADAFTQVATLEAQTEAQLPPAAFTGVGLSDLLMTNSNTGALVVDQVSNGAMTYTQIGALGAEWQFEGSGSSFLGDGNEGFLLWNGTSGGIVVGEDVNGTAQYTQVGGVGAEWQFEGNGTFLGAVTSDFLLWNSENGGIVVGSVVSGVAQYATIGGVGPEWQFEGTGDFLGDGRTGFLLWNGKNDGVVVGEDVNGAAQYTTIGGLGAEWQFEGTGAFFGNSEDDFLIWNQRNGAVDVGAVYNGMAEYTQISGLGSGWQFIGTGNYNGANNAEFMLRNSVSGGLVIGSVSGDSVTYTNVGGVGSEWNFHASHTATVA